MLGLRTESDRNELLTSITRPMPWIFEDPNVPPEVIAASAGQVQCLRTNGDGLCAVHSVFGVSRSTGYEAETEFYHNDAKTFIRESLGEDYMTFVHNLDCESIRAELEDMIWFDLVRPACLSVSGRASDPLSSETRQVYEKVSCDVALC